MRKFYGICKIVSGQVIWPVEDSRRWDSLKKSCEGGFLYITAGPAERLRTEDQHELYRVRNGVLSEYTGYTEKELHYQFFKKLGLGIWRATEDEAAATAYEVTRRFFRVSANEITRSQIDLLFKEQDKLAFEVNAIEPDASLHCVLPEGRVTKKLREKYLRG